MTETGETQTQRGLAFVGLVLMGLSAAVAPHPTLWIRAAPPAASTLLAIFGLVHPGAGAAVAILTAAISVVALAGLPWQATMPLALGVFLLASRARPAVGSMREPAGRVPLGGTIGCAAVTPFALVGWFVLFHPDLSDIARSLPNVGPLGLALGGIGFALVNASCEELIWRGILQSRLTQLLPARDAIFLQALSFGAQHAHGFPRGVVGVALAGIWAIGLGMLRKKAGGLLASTLAHVVADATIALILVFWVR